VDEEIELVNERFKAVELNDEERATYEWQIWAPDYGEKGQERVKGASALVSRLGGLGGPLAQQLAAAGFGKVVLAHGGDVKHSDLNRQVLMTYDWLGKPRVESAKRRLLELNPRMEIETEPSNITEDNVVELVSKVDLVFDCAPLFSERFLMNRECVRQNKPMIECAMYDLEGQITTIIPGETACLACIYPEDPPGWKREFPVFGAVSAMAAGIGAMEGIKLVSGMGPSLAGKLLYYDMRTMDFQKIPLKRNPDCPVCGNM
jgi:molybdopterin/thiamine biosynthesis adenylyltransferase